MHRSRSLFLALVAALLVALAPPADAGRQKPTSLRTEATPFGNAIDCGYGLHCWTLYAGLSDDRGTGIGGATLEYRLETGDVVCTIPTNEYGGAWCEIDGYSASTTYAGSRSYTVTFAGDARHAPTTATGAWNYCSTGAICVGT